ncbi:hypothetical protein AURDEDRAFT_116924 [Auricularia subglabra TFB-10046 SS5]|nr:hypothetical protein AURDEDRAFT_116924 [Auricularia subglabra TFB-10046 SS5]
MALITDQALTEPIALRVAQDFADSLTPPLKPTLCPICFIVFYFNLKDDRKLTLALQKKQHAFWDALMAFVSADWTAHDDAPVAALLHRIYLRCRRCVPRQPGQAKADLPESLFDSVYGVACQFLGNLLSTCLLVSRKGFSERNGRWPTSADQLFPYGADKTVGALAARLGTNADAAHVLNMLTFIHRPLVGPVLLQDQARVQVMASVISHLDACVSASAAELRAIPAPVPPSVRDAVVRSHLGRCPGFLLMLFTLAFGPGADADERDTLFAGYHAQVFKALDSVLSQLEGPSYIGRPGQDEILLARYVWGELPVRTREQLGCMATPRYLSDIEREGARVFANPYRVLHNHLREKVNMGRGACARQGCNTHVHDSGTSGGFARCGKCRFVQYCSRDCQKADWKGKPYPHREICDSLQELFSAAQISMTNEQFAAACRERDFPLARVDRLIEWASNGRGFYKYAEAPVPPFLDEPPWNDLFAEYLLNKELSGM